MWSLLFLGLTPSPHPHLGALFPSSWTSHASIVRSQTPWWKLAWAGSPRRWLGTRRRVASSQARSSQYPHPSRAPPSKRVDPQVPWPCWCGPEGPLPLTSYTSSTCNEWRGCWTSSASRGCCKVSSMRPQVPCTSWCGEVDYPPSWCQWWTWPFSRAVGSPWWLWGLHQMVEPPRTPRQSPKGPWRPTPSPSWTSKG